MLGALKLATEISTGCTNFDTPVCFALLILGYKYRYDEDLKCIASFVGLETQQQEYGTLVKIAPAAPLS